MTRGAVGSQEALGCAPGQAHEPWPAHAGPPGDLPLDVSPKAGYLGRLATSLATDRQPIARKSLVEPGGIEPPTSCMPC